MSIPDELAAFLDYVACVDFPHAAEDASIVPASLERTVAGPGLPTRMHAPRGAGDLSQQADHVS